MKAIITIDLGYGDAGKGTIVASLVQHHNSKLVVRYNGAFQAAHNVHQGKLHHTFAQFGSGTFDGARTILGPNVIINPLSMQVEAKALEGKGVKDPLSLITVSRSCVISTPFHKALNQIRELSKRRRHGSTGSGVGETKRMALQRESLTFRVLDIKDASDLIYKLSNIRNHCFTQCQELIFDYDILSDDAAIIMAPFYAKELPSVLITRYADWYNRVKVTSVVDIRNQIASTSEPVIFEGAQGLLLDKLHGFHPYTTWGDITTTNVFELLPPRYSIKYSVLGIIRTFSTRHGAGPFVTENANCTNLNLCDDNQCGKFQGAMRVGNLDLVALKYAILRNRINGLAVTHCDKLYHPETKTLCVDYDGADLLNYHCIEEAGLEALSFTQAYLKTKPILEQFEDPISFISKELDVPVVIQSYGKQTNEKTYMGQMPEDNDVQTEPTTETVAAPAAPVADKPVEVNTPPKD